MHKINNHNFSYRLSGKLEMTNPHRRLQKELSDLKSAQLKSFRDISVHDDNILFWSGLILPVSKAKSAYILRISSKNIILYRKIPHIIKEHFELR